MCFKQEDNHPGCSQQGRSFDVRLQSGFRRISAGKGRRQGKPVLVTMTLSDAFYRPDADGVVERNEPMDPKRHHAVVAVGHGQRGAAGFVLIRNSWGEAWGLKGHAWIAVDYLKPRLTGAAIMTTEP
ncbi:MAG: C1 family peptidase [Xanthobacteraceae bacterium]